MTITQTIALVRVKSPSCVYGLRAIQKNTRVRVKSSEGVYENKSCYLYYLNQLQG